VGQVRSDFHDDGWNDGPGNGPRGVKMRKRLCRRMPAFLTIRHAGIGLGRMRGTCYDQIECHDLWPGGALPAAKDSGGSSQGNGANSHPPTQAGPPVAM